MRQFGQVAAQQGGAVGSEANVPAISTCKIRSARNLRNPLRGQHQASTTSMSSRYMTASGQIRLSVKSPALSSYRMSRACCSPASFSKYVHVRLWWVALRVPVNPGDGVKEVLLAQ